MRTLLKVLAVLVVLAVVLAGAGLTYLLASYPDVPAAVEVTLPTDPDTLARGQYLAEHVTVCIDCHSERDFSRFAGPVKPGTFGQGGELFDETTAGVPGKLYASNITPAGLVEYTDGQLLHAVTTGVARDGRALFPLMPYPNYGRLDRQDVLAVLAYIRSLRPIENHVPARTLNPPLNLIVRTIPRPAEFVTRPSPGDRKAYGEYLVRAASCAECHTPMDNGGQRLPGMEFAGGMPFGHPQFGYRMVSANITPDADTGIGQWTEEQFVGKFKAFAAPDERVLNDDEQRQNTVMPWNQYAGMTREDLGAIYTYLRTLKPITNRVEKWPDAKGPTSR